MFLSAFGAAKPLGPTNDPFYSSVQFLQNFDTLSVGSVPLPLPNEKPSGAWSSNQSNDYEIVSSPSRFGNAAKYRYYAEFPPTGDALVLSGPSLSNFTLEFSFYLRSIVNLYLSFYLDVGYFSCDFPSGLPSQNFAFYTYLDANYKDTTFYPQVNTWYDIAVCSTLSDVKFFVNGVLKLTFPFSRTNLTSIVIPWGYAPDANGTPIIDDLRISDIVRYTTNYTPSHPFINA